MHIDIFIRPEYSTNGQISIYVGTISCSKTSPIISDVFFLLNYLCGLKTDLIRCVLVAAPRSIHSVWASFVDEDTLGNEYDCFICRSHYVIYCVCYIAGRVR